MAPVWTKPNIQTAKAQSRDIKSNQSTKTNSDENVIPRNLLPSTSKKYREIVSNDETGRRQGDLVQNEPVTNARGEAKLRPIQNHLWQKIRYEANSTKVDLT